MKQTIILIILIAALMLTACGASEEEAMQAAMTALAKTEAAEVVSPTDKPEEPKPTNTPRPTSTPKPPTDTPKPTAPPSADDLWAINYAAWQDSGGIVIEIARVLVGRKSALPSIDLSELEGDIVGELVFKITNNADVTANVYPDQGSVQIGGEQIELLDYAWEYNFGDDLGGEIYPGITKIGGLWFTIKRSQPGEITEIIFRCSKPVTADGWDRMGPEFEIVIPVEDPGWQDYPEELE